MNGGSHAMNRAWGNPPEDDEHHSRKIESVSCTPAVHKATLAAEQDASLGPNPSRDIAPCAHGGMCGRKPNLAGLKELEVRRRTTEAVDSLNSGALASLLVEAGRAADPEDPLTPETAVVIARYLLGARTGYVLTP